MSNTSTVRAGSSARTVLGSVRTAPYRAAAIALGALAADRAFDPNSNHVPFCPLHSLTGIWCPFCGGLRSAYELTRLHLRAALQDNVVFVAALPIIFALWLDWLLRARHGKRRRVMPRTAVIAVVAIAVLFTVLRNLPWFSVLRPTG